MINYNKYMTVRMLHQYIKLSESYIYKKVSSNTIPHIKVNRSTLFDKDIIDHWLANVCEMREDLPQLIKL